MQFRGLRSKRLYRLLKFFLPIRCKLLSYHFQSPLGVGRLFHPLVAGDRLKNRLLFFDLLSVDAEKVAVEEGDVEQDKRGF